MYEVSFFYTVSPLFYALGPKFNGLCDYAGEKNVMFTCATTNASYFSLRLKHEPF